MAKKQNDLLCGIAIALAAANRLHDCPTVVNDVLREHSISYGDLRRAGVDHYDLGEIRKCLAQGNLIDRAQVLAANDTL